MLFKNQIFKLQKQESYFKKQMNGFDDPVLSDFQALSYSSFLKKEFKHNKAEREYIFGYIEAAKIIAKRSPNIKGIKFMINDYSIALPAIFLCRQAIELSIKCGVLRKKGQYKPIHNLDDLWKIFEEFVDKNKITLNEKKLLSDMKGFVDIINTFDNQNGTKLRYPEGKDGTLNQETPVFVNLQQITETTELFVKQMELITEVNDK